MPKVLPCPYCNSMLNVDLKYTTYDCPNCGKTFRRRDGNTYKFEEIASDLLYYLILIFGSISKANPEYYDVYSGFVDRYIQQHDLTRLQYNDLKKVYENTTRSIFGFLNKYKEYITNLKKTVDDLYASKPMQEQETMENNLLILFYTMANLPGSLNEKQQEILNCMKNTFKFTDMRYNEVLKKSKPEPAEERVEVDAEQVFSNLKQALLGKYTERPELLDSYLNAFKRPFILDREPDKFRNVSILLTNEPDYVESDISNINNYLVNNKLLQGTIATLDMSMYADSEAMNDFISTFDVALVSESDVICLKDFKTANSKVIGCISEMIVNGKTTVEGTQLLSNDKYLFITTSGDEAEVEEYLSSDALERVNDIINVGEFSTDELKNAISNLINSLVGIWRNSLELPILYDLGIIDFLMGKYNIRKGLKGLKFYLNQNIYKPLEEFKLRLDHVVQGNIIVKIDGEDFYISYENTNVKLSDFVRQKKNLKVEDVKKELNSIIGLDTVKNYILKLEENVLSNQSRKEAGFKTTALSMNMIFTGNPGTGKTTIARIVAEYLKALGVLSKGQLVEVSRDDLVGEYQGSTATKTKEKISSAIGGVLFVDEAYSLCRDSQDSFGLEAVATLVKMMEDNKEDLVVILAGYSREMTDFMKSNSGLKSRFPHIIEFPDYTPREMYLIANSIAKRSDYVIDNSCIAPLISYFESKNIKGLTDGGNGRLARNTVENAILNQSRRIVRENENDYQLLKLADFELEEKVAFDLEKSLKDIIGLEDVKDFLRAQYNVLRAQEMRKAAGMPADSTQTLNMIFTGNPGTGKTTIARVVANMMKEMGLLKSGQLVEVSRANLVAEYVGQTAPKTEEVFKSALGGVLFIDEAYALSNGNDNFGKEAIDMLVKLIEDYRGEILVILAGYKREMGEFLSINSGLESRFPIVIDFPDYSNNELYAIFMCMLEKRGFILDDGAKEIATDTINKLYSDATESSGNGRMIRNFLEKLIRNQSTRIVQDQVPIEDVNKIIERDFQF